MSCTAASFPRNSKRRRFFEYADELLSLFPNDGNIKDIVDKERERANDNVVDLHAQHDRDDPDGALGRSYAVRDLPERDNDIRERDIFSDVADPA